MNNIEMTLVDSQVNGRYSPGIEGMDIAATGDTDLHFCHVAVINGFEQLLCRL